MQLQIHVDGSWDMEGEYWSIRGIVPCVDGYPVRPVRVAVSPDRTIVYELEEGSLTVTLRQLENQVSVACRLQGMSHIHDVEPIGCGRLTHQPGNTVPEEGRLKVFAQGFGMEGPSGCDSVEMTEKDSYGLMAVYEEDRILLLYSMDHTRFTNCYSAGFRERAFRQKAVELTGGFNLEGTGEEELTLPEIYLEEITGRPLEKVLRDCAEKIAGYMGVGSKKLPAYHWCSWYYHYQNMSQKLLEEYVKEFPQIAPGLQTIQIDAGYCPSLGDWLLPNHLFPDGLKQAAETIREAGYLPGIWIGPFMVGDQSVLYREHPDWILRDLQGNPVTRIRSYNEPKAWGNPDGNYYVLDTSHPEALLYLRKVFRTLKRWGFRLFKTDFMLWNMIDSSQVQRFDPSKTSVEILRNTLKMIREEIGEESYLLGCIAPFLPFLGYADGMRIAGDVGAQWEGAYGPLNLLQELVADNYFQNIYWQNDPDSMLLREFDIFLKPQETQSMALLQAVSGGVVTCSDPLQQLSKERQEFFRFLRPGTEKQTPQLPYFGENREELVLTHRLEQGNLLFVMNPTDRKITEVYDLKELFAEDGWYVRKWKEKEDSVQESRLFLTLKPHESALFFLTKAPLDREPENLWDWGTKA